MQRRDFIKSAATLAALPLSAKALAWAPQQTASADSLVSDEAYWRKVRSCYAMPDDVIQLENGNWGVMSRPVLHDYFKHTERVNRDSSLFSRRQFYTELKPIMARVATLLGCNTQEIAFARGASEVLNNLISGYRLLNDGDEVMYADVDYDSMQAAMRQKGHKLVKIDLPEQGSAADFVAYYRQALTQHPRVKLLLLTHLSHRHGLVLPIKQIVAMAREFDVDCIVDAAHSWGQLDFNLADLGADFVGFNLHKWLGAPIGCGVMYIKQQRLADITPAIGDGLAFNPSSHIGHTYQRVHTGTFNYAAWLTIPAALDFHETIGAGRKAARLHYLRRYWVNQARQLPQLQVVADNAAELHGGIAAFRINHNGDSQWNQQLAAKLLEQHQIFSVYREGLANGSCVRITPSVYTLTDELDSLLAALAQLAS